MPKYAPAAENAFSVRWDDVHTARNVVLEPQVLLRA
jgi:hypothetical protein